MSTVPCRDTSADAKRFISDDLIRTVSLRGIALASNLAGKASIVTPCGTCSSYKALGESDSYSCVSI